MDQMCMKPLFESELRMFSYDKHVDTSLVASEISGVLMAKLPALFYKRDVFVLVRITDSLRRVYLVYIIVTILLILPQIEHFCNSVRVKNYYQILTKTFTLYESIFIIRNIQIFIEERRNVNE